MNLPILLSLGYFVFLLIPSATVAQTPTNDPFVSAERTQAIALLFSMLQCQPSDSEELLGATQTLLPRANTTFTPENYMHEYSNITEIENLLAFVQKIKASGVPDNLPFTTDPETVNNFQIVLIVLWNNAQDWTLFYNTAAWLIGRVNSALLFWALMIVSAEKFSDTVVVPHAGEIFPQLYIQKELVLGMAGLGFPSPGYISRDPLSYWMGDPDLNDFHTHFHMDNPFWWDAARFRVFRYRKGEMFFYMHHQIVNRYNAERFSNWLPEVKPLELSKDFVFTEGFRGDVVNVDFEEFPSRPDYISMGKIDEGQGITIADMSGMHGRILEGINNGYLNRSGTNGGRVSLWGENGADILGATVEASFVYSPNYALYGALHNYIHSFLSGMVKIKRDPIPGVEAHQETSMRDRIFYLIHGFINSIYFKYKRQLTFPYTKKDLEFPGVAIMDVKLLTCTKSTPASFNYFYMYQQETSTIMTYMTTQTFDISTVARPCRSVHDQPAYVQVPILNYVPFNYVITLQSWRPQVAYGMVRIFMWLERKFDGTPLEGDEAHVRAIELDRFRIRIAPNTVSVITRSSLNSSLTKSTSAPGIKTLFNVDPGSGILNPEMRRACGFPNHLLIPKGTREGMAFKLTVYISDETDMGNVDETQYFHYPFCGALKGLPFPDKRSMGFPFDRPGTDFSFGSENSQFSSILGCSKMQIPNVKQMKVIVKHSDTYGTMYM